MSSVVGGNSSVLRIEVGSFVNPPISMCVGGFESAVRTRRLVGPGGLTDRWTRADQYTAGYTGPVESSHGSAAGARPAQL